MEREYSFLIDNNSRVVSWGKSLSQITRLKSSKAVGKAYHDVFPRLLSDNKDAVSLAMSNNKKVLLKGYTLECPFKSMSADILIERAANEKGPAGARVTLSNVVC